MSGRRKLIYYGLVLTLGLLVSIAMTQDQQQQQSKQGLEERVQQGQQIFMQMGCTGCHGANGTGVSTMGPALSGNPELESASHVINQILYGNGVMPSFAPQLTDTQIAAVATYVRNSWGNSFGGVTTEMVTQISGRGQTQAQQEQPAEQVADTERTGDVQHHAVLTSGQALYGDTCAACHGTDGGGATQFGFGPALADNPHLQNTEQLIRLLLTGSGDMPAYDYWLSEEQLAAVVSFVRTNFGNSFGEVSAEQIGQIKQQIQPR